MATSRRSGRTGRPPWWPREAAVYLPQVWQWRFMHMDMIMLQCTTAPGPNGSRMQLLLETM